VLFDTAPAAHPHPNVDKLKAFDAYYAWPREHAKARK